MADGFAREVVRLERISKSFGVVKALQDVSITFRSGEIHALVGENGAGKSTLMNILYGILQSTSGCIVVEGDDVTPHWSTRGAIASHIGMIHQHFSLISEYSVLENVIMPTLRWSDILLDWNGHRARLSALAQEFEFDLPLDRPVESLSIGQRQQVEILKMLYQGAKVLILDEPTTVLTPQQTDQLLRMLIRFRALGQAVVIITHKLEQALELADVISVLRTGTLVRTMRRGEVSVLDVAKMMVAREITAKPSKRPIPQQDVALALEGVSIEEYGLTLLDKLTLTVHAGEIIGMVGVAGNGQNELADAILGIRKVSRGRIAVAGIDITRHSVRARRRIGLAAVPDDRHEQTMVSSMTVGENLILGREGDPRFSHVGILKRKAVSDFARACMRDFDIRAPGLTTLMDHLSGGNQQKVVFGRELSSGPKLIIAHEPSRGLDFAATDYVRGRLVRSAEDGAGVLLISSDLDELMELSNGIVVIFNGRIVGSVDAESYDPERLGLLMSGAKEES